MKTKNQIEAKKRQIKKRFTNTERNFEKYDNHEDMEELVILVGQLEILAWVLGEKE